MLTVTSTSVYGLYETMVASGFPMCKPYTLPTPENRIFKPDSAVYYYYDYDSEFDELVDEARSNYLGIKNGTHYNRLLKLSDHKSGESHHCALCGIIVQMNVTAPLYWWPEMQRYHFVDIISSTSTMHRLARVIKESIDEERRGNKPNITKYFTPETNVDVVMDFYNRAKEMVAKVPSPPELKQQLKAMLPSGYLQTARLSTNYRQLKTIREQREKHTLKEWRDFCAWIGSLPCSELI